MADFEPAGLEEKEVMMRQLGYSPDLKAAILGMMEPNHTLRYSLRHLLHLAKENKSRHFWSVSFFNQLSAKRLQVSSM